MVTETMIIEPIIKKAMEKVGFQDKSEILLDALYEIEIDRHLAISIEQMNRGEYITIEELKKRMDEKFKSGYYSKKRPLVDEKKIAKALKSLEPIIIKEALVKVGLEGETQNILDAMDEVKDDGLEEIRCIWNVS